MKIILVDAVDLFISDIGVIDQKIYELLEEYATPKIIVTNAPAEKFEEFGLNYVPYPVFTLSKQPSKSDPEYFNILFEEYSIFASECIYIEHNKEAVASAQSVGIKSYYFNSEKKDLKLLKEFIDNSI
ncbi:MAG: HAD superfamily hydrolase (TIGR01509 family) [Crocinitomicaceae bacterium]|jgi:HAD superfamily hydrolase (TIGR01509 family)